MKQEKVYCDRELCATQLQNNEGCDKCIAVGDMKDAEFERMAEALTIQLCGYQSMNAKILILKALRQAHKEGQLEAEKAIRCEWMDPSGTIWEHADMVQKENEALNLSIGVINQRLMEAMDIINQYANGNASLLLLHQRADKFLKGEK